MTLYPNCASELMISEGATLMTTPLSTGIELIWNRLDRAWVSSVEQPKMALSRAYREPFTKTYAYVPSVGRIGMGTVTTLLVSEFWFVVTVELGDSIVRLVRG
uniref:(northern house mosquito) hypothetical protein n=1 Tax=Culex pipiens TaxID=7175 RepID=A0A8D8B796_CULPI